MWQPKEIIIENLMTHKSTKYSFSKNTCTMIFGINESDNGADSNGSGKSTLIEGITLATTGLTCRDVNKDEFISDGENESYVQFDLTNEICDTKHLSIRRWFHRKKASRVEIWENNELNREITSVNEANSHIYSLIGLTRDDLLHFFIVGQDTNFSFLTVNDTEKNSIISRLSNSDKINEIIEKLKSDVKLDENGQLRNLATELTKVETKISLFESDIEDINENGKNEINDKIVEIQSDIEDNESEILDLKKSKNKLITERGKLFKEMQDISVDSKSKNDIESRIEILEEKKRKFLNKKNKTNSTIDQLENIKEGAIQCPKCNESFNPSSDIDIDEVDDLISFSKEELVEIEYKISLYKRKISAATEELSEVSSLVRKKKVLNDKVIDSDSKLKSFDRQIEIALNTISKLEDSKDKISKQSDYKDKIKSLKLQIAESERSKSNIESKISDIQSVIDEKNFWIYHFGKKGFGTFLRNKSVKTIEGFTNSYLKRFNSDLQVQIDGHTILKSGDISEKINISIVRNGKHIGSFKRYSGGERGRINLANIVGLQKLINMSANNGGLNFLALDEVFDGLDSSGQKDVIKILENIGVTTLVVSHSNNPIGSENELFIKKVDGISNIVI